MKKEKVQHAIFDKLNAQGVLEMILRIDFLSEIASRLLRCF